VGIDGDVGSSNGKNCKVREKPLGTVLGEEGNFIAGAYPEMIKTKSNPFQPPGSLPLRNALPASPSLEVQISRIVVLLQRILEKLIQRDPGNLHDDLPLDV